MKRHMTQVVLCVARWHRMPAQTRHLLSACLFSVFFRCACVVAEKSFNDKDNYVEDVTDADFYKCIQLNSTLPGASQLQVGLWHCDPC